jgi:hypothetical protein
VINELIPDTAESVIEHRQTRRYFFVTKDHNFRSDSKFDKKLSHGMTENNTRIKLIPIPSKGEKGRDLHRAQILEKVIAKLNEVWNELSPT